MHSVNFVGVIMRDYYSNVIKNIQVGYACHRRVNNGKNVDIRYEIIEVNKEFEAILGKSSGELIGCDSSLVMASFANNGIASRDVHCATHHYGKNVSLKLYSTIRERWYDVDAFRVKDNHIVSILTESGKPINEKQHFFNASQYIDHCIILVDTVMNALFEKNHREMLHSKRVGSLCEAIAENMKGNNIDVKEVTMAGLLHDIGKIAVSNDILDKKGKLTTEEWDQIKTHCEKGYRILCGSLAFSRISDFVYEHHERLDGSGYPRGLRKAEISMGARIIAVADTFDAMISERPYRKAFSEGEALEELHKHSGNHFDSKVIDVMTDIILKKIWKITDMD